MELECNLCLPKMMPSGWRGNPLLDLIPSLLASVPSTSGAYQTANSSKCFRGLDWYTSFAVWYMANIDKTNTSSKKNTLYKHDLAERGACNSSKCPRYLLKPLVDLAQGFQWLLWPIRRWRLNVSRTVCRLVGCRGRMPGDCCGCASRTAKASAASGIKTFDGCDYDEARCGRPCLSSSLYSCRNVHHIHIHCQYHLRHEQSHERANCIISRWSGAHFG